MIDARPFTSVGTANRARVVVSTSLDKLDSAHVRFLQEAARLGSVHVRLWSDALVASLTGSAPLFPQTERLFLSRALRYVDRVSLVRRTVAAAASHLASTYDTLVVPAREDDRDLRARCLAVGMDYAVIGPEELTGFPAPQVELPVAPTHSRRVVVTGCFDWFHSGHVQFFADAAEFGELYVVVGSDENVRLLKGPGHPLRAQDERRYMVEAVRSVHAALISTGKGWMDAEPEIDAIDPQVYVVNEDGDQSEKRAFCRAHGLDYVVLQRRPHPDLPRRSSSELRGY